MAFLEYFADGESGDSIRKKINGLANILRVATITTTIAAGTKTSLGVTGSGSTTGVIATSGDVLYLVDALTGEETQITLSADYKQNDTSMSISSHVFAADIPAGSFIFPLTYHNFILR